MARVIVEYENGSPMIFEDVVRVDMLFKNGEELTTIDGEKHIKPSTAEVVEKMTI